MKIYVDWTTMGPGAEPDDAERFASFIQERLPDAEVILSPGPMDDLTIHAVNRLFEEFLRS